jgi:3-oxoadipate enol-lactonase
MNTNRIETDFQVTEAGSGEPVICIHGNGLNRDLWRHLVPDLSPRYRCVVYELRGMGKAVTVEKPGSKITVEDHADDLGAIMDGLGIERAVMVAHAYGGFVAMRFAIDHPQRVGGLIMACTAARLEGSTRQVVPNWIETTERVGMQPLIEKAIDRWFVAPFRDAHPEIMDLYRKMIGDNPPLGYAANARGILEYDIREQLHRIGCPTLLVTGEADYSTPVADHEFIAEHIENSELIVVENASHTVPEEQPQEFNSIVLRFLDQHAARG